jgi:methylthioribose-1-phosphate isomerase
MDDDGRRNVLRATAALLRRARPASMALAATLDDCAAAWVDEPSADACARSLEAIASASAALARGATGSVAAHASHVLRTLPAGDVVLHGASSEQAGGELGLAAALAQGLGTKSGRSFLVAASSPTGEGTAVRDDLLRAGVRTSLIADAAVASVMASGAVAVALVAAEWVGADGSIVAPAGALGLAALAAYRQVPLLVLDASGVSPRPLPTLPPPRPDSLARPTHDAPPLMDVVPPELVTALVRMEGIA